MRTIYILAGFMVLLLAFSGCVNEQQTDDSNTSYQEEIDSDETGDTTPEETGSEEVNPDSVNTDNTSSDDSGTSQNNITFCKIESDASVQKFYFTEESAIMNTTTSNGGKNTVKITSETSCASAPGEPKVCSPIEEAGGSFSEIADGWKQLGEIMGSCSSIEYDESIMNPEVLDKEETEGNPEDVLTQ